MHVSLYGSRLVVIRFPLITERQLRESQITTTRSCVYPWRNFSLLLITSNSTKGTPLKGSHRVTLKSLGLVEGNFNTLPSTFLTKLRGAIESLSKRSLRTLRSPCPRHHTAVMGFLVRCSLEVEAKSNNRCSLEEFRYRLALWLQVPHQASG